MVSRDKRGVVLRRAILGLVVLSAFTPSRAAADRAFGHYPRPLYFRPSHNIANESTSVIAAFDAVVTSTTTDTGWLEALKSENDQLLLLSFLSGTTVMDTVEAFDPSDSSGVLEHRRVHAVANDWFIHDVHGRPITTWEGAGRASWLLNLTAHAREDDAGDRFGEWNGRTLARAMTGGVGDFLPSPAWDGIMLDQLFDSITWLENRFGNGQIDADADGAADDHGIVNQAWRDETAIMFGELRNRVGDDFVLAMNGETRVLGDVDGASFEECLHHRSWWTDMYGYGDGHGGYLSGIARCRPGPNRFGVFYARYFVGITDIPFDQFARLAAGSSALGDGYYILETWDAGTYDAIERADVYDLDWGVPLGEMDRFPVGADTLYGRAFSHAYLEVNPYDHPIIGVPARDLRVTTYATPDVPAVDPAVDAATLHLPGLPEENSGAVIAIDVRYSTRPITEANFDDAIRVRLYGEAGSGAPLFPAAPFSAVIEGLEAESWYHVSSRFHYRGGVASPVAPSLAFRTQPETPDWQPPEGAGPEGDDRWMVAWNAVGPNGAVRAIHVDASSVTLGGDFSHVGDIEVGGVARYEDRRWRPLADPKTDPLSGDVHALIAIDDAVVVGGEFNAAGDRSASVAMWRGVWMPLGDGVDGVVHGLDLLDDRLVVAGSFRSHDVGGPGFAVFDDGAWARFGVADSVRVRSGGRFGGRFGVWRDRVVAQALVLERGADGELTAGEHVVRWTGKRWERLGGEVRGNVFAYVEAPDGTLVVGGDFSSIGGVAANHVARWTDEGWEPLGTGLDAPVRALAVTGDLVVAGGEFARGGHEPVPHLGRWDGTFWTPVGTGVDGPVTALAPFGDGVVVGGTFTRAGDESAVNIASWGVPIDGTTPNEDDPIPPGTPVIPSVVSLHTMSANPATHTEFAFTLPHSSPITLNVFDVAGRRVRRLIDATFDAGIHRTRWNGRTDGGAPVASGVYFVRLRAGSERRQVTVHQLR